MNLEQLRKDFFPKEIVLKLHKEIPSSNYLKKIEMVKAYANEVSQSYDKDVLEIKLNNEIGFWYWDAEEYPFAIEHFEKAIDLLKPHDYPSLYFHIIGMLVRCNRLISNYGESMEWIKTAFRQIDHTHSYFEKLNVLNEYVDLLDDSKRLFDLDYIPIIKTVIDELGFPEKLGKPIETIQSMRNRNLYWNQKLMDVKLMNRGNKDRLIEELTYFMESCEIDWYKRYVKDQIILLFQNE